jgi:hypothetical protein
MSSYYTRHKQTHTSTTPKNQPTSTTKSFKLVKPTKPASNNPLTRTIAYK